MLFRSGAQIERRLLISVKCIVPRQLIGEKHRFVRGIIDSVFPNFIINERSFTPINLRCKDDDGQMNVEFEIFFCDVLNKEEASSSLMTDITFDINGKYSE